MTQGLVGVNRQASPIDGLASTIGPSSGFPWASERSRARTARHVDAFADRSAYATPRNLRQVIVRDPRRRPSGDVDPPTITVTAPRVWNAGVDESSSRHRWRRRPSGGATRGRGHRKHAIGGQDEKHASQALLPCAMRSSYMSVPEAHQTRSIAQRRDLNVR
jgi:hypothetical protein